MSDAADVEASIDEHVEVITALRRHSADVLAAGRAIVSALRGGGRVLLCGNGGSAADAQHIAAEIVGRFERERQALPALALTTDSSVLTAVANDFGFEWVFARQVEALGEAGDVLVGISTSGASANVIRAFESARDLGVITIALTGNDGGRLAALADLAVIAPSQVTARIQECHILVGHIWSSMVDRGLNP